MIESARLFLLNGTRTSCHHRMVHRLWTLCVKKQEDCLDLASIMKDLLNLEGALSLCDLLVHQEYEKDAFTDFS